MIFSFIGPPLLMEEPWRSHIQWTTQYRQQLLEDLSDFEVKGEVPYLNCLLLGQVASGKTSFFNTCLTAVKDERRMINTFAVLKPSVSSVTKKVNEITF